VVFGVATTGFASISSGSAVPHEYHAAMGEGDREDLSSRLQEVEAESRGFAFEGAAMGLFLLHHRTP
jgi:enediyne biosynthesis protein E3